MPLTLEQCKSRSILRVLAGSHIHGLNVPSKGCYDHGLVPCDKCTGEKSAVIGSDRDEEAIVVEPLSEAWHLGKPWEDFVKESPELDTKFFSLRKWCSMAVRGNPNFLLMLFAPESHVLSCNALGAQLREMREAFISKQAIKSHLGYMQGQRTRMLNQIACHEEVGKNGGHGKPRHDLCEKYGYDTKFAMHLLRLGCQGAELATSGRITLPMVDTARHALLDVRAGKLSLSQVLEWADDLEGRMKTAFDTCSLPDQPNIPVVEEWMQRVYIRAWSADRKMQDILEDSTIFAGALMHGGTEGTVQ